jgi:hypothetical protein
MLSMNDLSMSGDSLAAKIAFYGKNWTVMMAGDLSPYPEIKEKFKEVFINMGAGAFTRRIFVEALQQSFTAELKRKAEVELLSPFGMTFNNYRDEGPKLGPEMYSRLLYDLRELDLGLTLLVAGFDDKVPCVFKIEGKGIARNYQCPWAIGSGEQAALGYLFATQTNIFSEEDEVFYRVCCAKFAAETSPGVGKQTMVVRMKKDEEQVLFVDDDIKSIREDWNRTQQLKLPLEKKKMADNIIQQKLKEEKEKESSTQSVSQTSEQAR